MAPRTDATALIGIYNRMLAPAEPKTTATFDAATDRVLFSREIGGIRFMFVGLWPDSVARRWMEQELASTSATAPVVVFAHDQP